MGSSHKASFIGSSQKRGYYLFISICISVMIDIERSPEVSNTSHSQYFETNFSSVIITRVDGEAALCWTYIDPATKCRTSALKCKTPDTKGEPSDHLEHNNSGSDSSKKRPMTSKTSKIKRLFHLS